MEDLLMCVGGSLWLGKKGILHDNNNIIVLQEG